MLLLYPGIYEVRTSTTFAYMHMRTELIIRTPMCVHACACVYIKYMFCSRIHNLFPRIDILFIADKIHCRWPLED